MEARLVLLDLEAPPPEDLDLPALRAMLAEARARRLAIAHGYRGGGGGARHKPLPGLSPLPNEPVFLRDKPNAFSSRAFRSWVGAAPASLIFVGGAHAVRRSAEAASVLGHRVYLLMRPANSDAADAYWRQLHPYLPSRFFAPAEIALFSISQATRGVANGQA
jgi:hypothetical protein